MEHLQQAMGTVVSYSIAAGTTTDADATASSTAVAAAALERAVASMTWADDVFSTWKPGSPVSRLRRGEITLDEAPSEVADVLELCREARDASGGWFDPWRIPGGVDPTGLVKGWAAARALDQFRTAGVEAAMVNAGGDIAMYGEPEPGKPWRIGIRHPDDAMRLLCVIEVLGAGAVATSGTYERGAHLVDPNTGEPARGLQSATVVGPNLSFTDALATALFVSGGKALEYIERLQGYSGFVVEEDGSLRGTRGFLDAMHLVGL